MLDKALLDLQLVRISLMYLQLVKSLGMEASVGLIKRYFYPQHVHYIILLLTRF